MKSAALYSAAILLAAGLTGCVTAYRWDSSVPERVRTVCVPTFRNESDVTELGSVVTRQILRELQREGTFKIRRCDDAAIEIQGTIVEAKDSYGGADRRSGARLAECVLTVSANVSVVDRVNGKVLLNNKPYQARATFVIGQDRLTGERNASGRAAEDLARQVVDDLTSMQW